MTRIVAVSDIHREWRKVSPPPGDVLVIAGDVCEPKEESFASADAWLASISGRFGRVLYVPGNHDANILAEPSRLGAVAPNLVAAMLIDETVVVDGLAIHGMPWESPGRSNPELCIPSGLDVLITHEPPQGIRDWSPRSRLDRLGNRVLRNRVEQARPRLHIFGHCHMAHGHESLGDSLFVNVAICGQLGKYYRAAWSATVINVTMEGIEILPEPHFP